MIELLQLLKKLFSEVTAQSFLELNTSDEIVYPYLTYSVDAEYLTPNMDGFYLDIDLFDRNTSYTALYELEDKLRKQFDREMTFTDGIFFRSSFQRSTSVPTLDDTLKRRNLQFYCKVDWRNK